MIHVRLPNGGIAKFPDSTPHEQIKTALLKRFPPPRPTSLAPGEKAQRAHGYVTHNAEFDRFMVYENGGKLQGIRTSLTAALNLADIISPPPQPRRQPKTEPEPSPPMNPVKAGDHISNDIDRAIRKQECQARSDARKMWQKRRHRNRGTLDR